MDKKRIGLYTKLYEYFLLLRKPFADFMEKTMRQADENNWWEKFVLSTINEPYKKDIDDLDMYDLLNILINHWGVLYDHIEHIDNIIFVYDENCKLINGMLHLRNVISHANEKTIFINDMYEKLDTLLKFAVFINAYENIIIKLKSDIEKYKKEKDTGDKKKREKLLDVIIGEVLFSAMLNNTLDGKVRASIISTIITLQNFNTADEVYDFFSGALQSSKGNWVYQNLKEKNLVTFEDIRDKINAIMYD